MDIKSIVYCTGGECTLNESTTGADASVEVPKL